jgi:ABC-type dipeptide/oligopeptide/nickel transport system permease component
MRMWIYVVRRLILLIPIIVGVMTITFILVSSLPVVDQLTAYYGPPPQRGRTWLYDNPIPCSLLNASQKGECTNPYYEKLLANLGLNLPLPEQWAKYMYRALTFQWGTVDNHSTAGTTAANGIAAGHPVIQVLAWFLPYTLELAVLALIIILAVSIPLGNLSAVYRNRPIDQASRIMSFSGYAMPSFLLASLILMALVLGLGPVVGYGVKTPWCPSGETIYDEFYGSWPIQQCFANGVYPAWLVQGVISSPTGFPTIDAMIHGQYWMAADTLIRMIFPAIVIAFISIAGLLRFVRNSMLEVMNLDFIRTARAKGVPEPTVIKRHAGRNSLNVTITVLGLTFAFFIGGFPVIEEVFGLKGVGYLLALSVQKTQYPIDFGLIFGSVLLFTYIVVIANIIVDVLYAYLDPRVRLG